MQIFFANFCDIVISFCPLIYMYMNVKQFIFTSAGRTEQKYNTEKPPKTLQSLKTYYGLQQILIIILL